MKKWVDRLESAIYWCKILTLIEYVICLSALLTSLDPFKGLFGCSFIFYLRGEAAPVIFYANAPRKGIWTKIN